MALANFAGASFVAAQDRIVGDGSVPAEPSRFAIPVEIIEDEGFRIDRELRDDERLLLERDGLKAQQGIQQLTGEISKLSQQQLIVSVVGSILLLFSLVLTARATASSARGARASARGARASAKAFHAQIRPVLIAVPPAPEDLQKWLNKTSEPLFFGIKNIGPGAAILRVLQRACTVIVKAPDGQKQIMGRPHSFPIYDECLVSKSSMNTQKDEDNLSCAITKTNCLAIGSGDSLKSENLYFGDIRDSHPVAQWHNVYVHGYIEYEDIAGGRYRSGYCFFVGLDDSAQQEKRFHAPWHLNTEGIVYHDILRNPD